MVALNEKFSHSGVPASEGRVSPDEIDAFDFTKRSGEVRGGSVANSKVAGSCGLFGASPSGRRSAAPVNRNGPETQFYYVRNRVYNPALGRGVQRYPIGYSGGINLFEYVGGRAVVALDPTGTSACLNAGPPGACCQPPRRGCANEYCGAFAGLTFTPALANPGAITTGFSLVSWVQAIDFIDKINNVTPIPGMDKQTQNQVDNFIRSQMFTNGYSVWIKVEFLSCDDGKWGKHQRYSMVDSNAGSPFGPGVFGGQAGGRNVTRQDIEAAVRSALRPAGGC